jgi:hypothetical protein
MGLLNSISQYWFRVQMELFPWLESTIGGLSEKQALLVTILELVKIEEFVPSSEGGPGRTLKERAAIARAYVAKAFYNMPTTRCLLDRLANDEKLRRICGWERAADIPSESTFSRAFAEFSLTQLPVRVHAALISDTVSSVIVGHLSRDSTEIESREKPVKKEKKEDPGQKDENKRGRPKKGEEIVKEPTRLEKQRGMSLEEMLEDLPKKCDVGVKRNSKGHTEHWIGYKLHIDAADGHIPISCLLTSASLHDSQAALPLAEMSRTRVVNLYDLMDAAYDAPIIREHSQSLGHVPIIDINPRRNITLKEELKSEARRLETIHFQMPEARRYNERSNVERVNGRLKDEFGGRTVRVRGCAKVMSHLMFGLLVLTADQLLRLIT